MTKPVERVPDLRDQVYERLRQRLRAGAYASDARLLEQSVAEEYGVSRTPAREALVLLAAEGLLLKEDRAFKPKRFEQQELFDLYEVRLRLEPYAVRKIAEQLTEKDARAIKRLIYDELRATLEGPAYVEAHGRVFHSLFALVTNPRLKNMIELYHDSVQYVRLHTFGESKYRAISSGLWRKLADALGSRDPRAAEKAQTEILIKGREAIEAVLSAASAAKAGAERPKQLRRSV